MNDRILVATDLDAGTSSALAGAVGPFMGADRVLALCHVRWEAERSLESSEREKEARARDSEQTHLLERWSATFLPDLPRELLVEPATGPYLGIERVAERWNADLIALAASGASGIWRALVPAVSDLAVRRSRANVLVARPSPSPGLVLVATDLSDPSFAAVATAAAEARRRGSSLVVVHVIDGSWSRFYAGGGDTPRYETRAAAERWVEHAMAKTGTRGEIVIVEGAATSQIVDRATVLGAELVVVASHGHTGLSRVLLGSVAEEVTRTAPCSVLVVRRHDV